MMDEREALISVLELLRNIPCGAIEDALSVINLSNNGYEEMIKSLEDLSGRFDRRRVAASNC